MRKAKLKYSPELDMGLAAIILDCRDRDFLIIALLRCC